VCIPCCFIPYYGPTVPGQKPDALSGLEQSWSKVMRQENGREVSGDGEIG